MPGTPSSLARLLAFAIGLALLASTVARAQTPEAAPDAAAEAETAALIDQALAGDHRDPVNVARDRYRHPKETLLFFGLRPDMTVVELNPSRGWYTEVLAPVLRERGRYYAAGFGSPGPELPEMLARLQAGLEQKLAARPDVYDRVVLTSMRPAKTAEFAPAGSADLVLTFRNVHNWMANDTVGDVLAAAHRALRPGGTLGVVEHRAAPGTPVETMVKSGYVTEEKVIELAEAAGFELVDRSEVNANPLDTRDHPGGVWSLPPSLRSGEENRDRYLAIGESDRMTLKFRKR